MDVIGRSPAQSLGYSPRSVHPTPYLRTFLVMRAVEADGVPRARLPSFAGRGRSSTHPRAGHAPPRLLATADRAIPMRSSRLSAYTPFTGLGGKALSATSSSSSRGTRR